MTFELIESSGAPIKAWTRGVQVEEQARQQLRNLAAMPFIFRHVAAMPDVHWGIGATVGSVIATKGAIIPASVGVDIGCGLAAQRTTLRASDMPDGLARLRTAIERRIPHGRTNHGGSGDRGAWGQPPAENADLLSQHFEALDAIIAKHPKLERAAGRAPLHAGTLGTGNHFIEVCLDEDQRVWVMLHSGSRGIGNAIGQYFIEAAKKDMERFIANLPDRDLAYLSEGSELFDDYFQAVGWAQVYARLNRSIMMREALAALAESRPEAHALRRGCSAMPPQLRAGRAPLRRERDGDAEGRRRRALGRARDHPRQHGREVVHRPRQGQPRFVLLVLSRRGPQDEPGRGQAPLHFRPTTTPPLRASSAGRTPTSSTRPPARTRT